MSGSEEDAVAKGIAGGLLSQPDGEVELDLVRRQDAAQDVRLKKVYAYFLLSVMVAQLAAADAGFFLYGSLGVDWRVEMSVMHVWLGATVVEVIGIVLVVTRYLFPRRDQLT